ncbi:hypothetical protein Q0M94_28100 (plasmid) [Deinococcus radiomollis]|uniref:hypothetical protein n=1 Tax=Deinococcus radiomollis TaxID=468916 RepID=UPI0038925FB4
MTRLWIQSEGKSKDNWRGHEIRARIRKWVEVHTDTPLHLFDHTRIHRVDGYLVIETEPRTDLVSFQLEQAFSGFRKHDWSIKVEASQRGEECALITLTSPADWVLPTLREMGLKRVKYGLNSVLTYSLP